MMRPLVRILVALALVIAAIQFVPVERTDPAVDSKLEVRGSVTDILVRSCFDCHSHRTSWPWYSRVAPVSWLLSHHVEEGRQRLDFSLWQQYSLEKQQRLSAEAVEEVDRNEMPLPMHLVLHPVARISGSDRERLAAWAQSLRDASPGGDPPR